MATEESVTPKGGKNHGSAEDPPPGPAPRRFGDFFNTIALIGGVANLLRSEQEQPCTEMPVDFFRVTCEAER